MFSTNESSARRGRKGTTVHLRTPPARSFAAPLEAIIVLVDGEARLYERAPCGTWERVAA